MIILEDFYKALLIVHLLGTFVLMGSMTHNSFILIGYIRGKFNRRKREFFFLKCTFWSYLIVYIFGAVIYPAFRIYIRGLYFDKAMPWATGLFEVKEHWAVIGLVLLFVCYIVRKSFDPQNEKHKLFLYVPLCLILNAIVWYVVISGCYLSMLKGNCS